MNTYAIEDLMTEALQAIINGADMDSTLADYQAQAEAATAQQEYRAVALSEDRGYKYS